VVGSGPRKSALMSGHVPRMEEDGIEPSITATLESLNLTGGYGTYEEARLGTEQSG